VYRRFGLDTVQGKTIRCQQAFLVAGHTLRAGARPTAIGPSPRSTGFTSFRITVAVATLLGLLPRQHKAKLP
jgi:hypothetical protein